MSIDWIIRVLVLALAGLLGLHLKHGRDCAARERARATSDAKISEQLALLQQTNSSILKELGDRETGIRGQLHGHTREIILLKAKAGLA